MGGFIHRVLSCPGVFSPSPCLRVTASPRLRVFSQARSRKILFQNSLIARTARGHYVRAFLTKAEAVTKTATAKDEIRSATRNLKARTLQHVPAECTLDDDFEVPTANDFSLFA